MRNICLVSLCLLLLGCKSKTSTLNTRDVDALKVVLPEGIGLATDSVQINVTDKHLVNKINWKIVGTEPFWNISIKADSVTYYTLENQKVGERFIITSSTTVRDGKNYVTAYEYTLNNSGKINIIITKERCSDGMSDMRYPYSAKIRYSDINVNGCAEKK